MVKVTSYDIAQLHLIEETQAQALAGMSDWFIPIVLVAAKLEQHGSMKIKSHLESLNVSSELIDSLLEPLYLLQIARCLSIMKVIDEKELKTIRKINEVRKQFIHRRGKGKFKRGKDALKTYDNYVDEAKRILKEKLGVVRFLVG